MRALKWFFWILVLFAVVAAFGLHGFVRSSRGKELIAKQISQATGFKATVGDARLSGCKLALSDVKVWYAEADGAEKVVLAAPEIVVSRLDGRRKVFMARPAIAGFQSELSDWTPAGLLGFVDASNLEKALVAVSRSAEVWFVIAEARLVLHDAAGKALTSYSGVNWTHLPVAIPGRAGMTYDQVAVQAINGEPTLFLKEWLDDGRLTVALHEGVSASAPASAEADKPEGEAPKSAEVPAGPTAEDPAVEKAAAPAAEAPEVEAAQMTVDEEGRQAE